MSRRTLFLISVASLYLELMLIRWIGTEIRVFGFFQNLALIACFLGFGLGCYRADEKANLIGSIKGLAVLAVLVSIPVRPWQNILLVISDGLSLSPDAAVWGPGGINVFGNELVAGFMLSCAIVAVLIILLAIVMVPFGQLVATYINRSSNVIEAYSINLVGSIVGVWLMAGVSFLRMPPVVWFALFFVITILAWPEEKRNIVKATAFMLVALALLYFGRDYGSWTLWSPYQKLTVEEHQEQNYQIKVNNSNYMTIGNASREYLASHPEIAHDLGESSYDSPFQFATKKDRILIVGSGAGNDVAAALRNGAEHIDAVEIDPTIESIGARLHPEKPYESPRVHTVINDARNVLRSQHQKYDVIIFGLLDSHTGFSSYSNMRVDNYVYTKQAFESARNLLNPDGILILKFEVRKPWAWIGQRFYAMLTGIFGQKPVVYYGPSIGPLLSGTVFIESDSPRLWTRATEDPVLRRLVAEHPASFPLALSGAPVPTSDDWPYVYHETRSIPRTYLTVMVILLTLSYLSVRKVFDPQSVSTWEFFFLGAGFLLLETQLINRLALYFGSTWIVNCIAISVTLTVLVIANICVERGLGSRIVGYYGVLLLSLILIYLAPISSAPTFSSTMLGLLLCLSYAVPVFCAGVIFTRALQQAHPKTTALGANILGAVAGGLVQNLSFIFGLNAMLIAAACLYLGAAVARSRKATPKWAAAVSAPD